MKSHETTEHPTQEETASAPKPNDSFDVVTRKVVAGYRLIHPAMVSVAKEMGLLETIGENLRVDHCNSYKLATTGLAYFQAHMMLFHFCANKNLSVQTNQLCCRGCRTTSERIESFWKIFDMFIYFQ